MFILVLVAVFPYMNEIAGKGIGPEVLGKLIFYASGRVFLMALPVAILASSLMAFGSLGEKNELAAMKSSGINLMKLMRSTLGFAIILTLFSLWFSFEIVPRANLKFFALFYDITRKKAELAIQPGFFYDGIDDYVIRVSDKNTETGTLFDVMIYNHTDSRANPDIIHADSARMFLKGSVMRMVFYHGYRYEDVKPEAGQPDKFTHSRTYFDSLYYRFVLEGFELERTDESQFKHQIVLRKAQLNVAIDSLQGLEVKQKKNHLRQVGRYNRIDTFFTEPGASLASVKPKSQKDRKNKSARQTAKHRTDSLRQIYLGDYRPYVSIELDSNQQLIDCFDLSAPRQQIDIYNRSITSAKAAKNYVDYMIKKDKDQALSQIRYGYESQQRNSLPFNSIVFMLIGASLGAIIRRGGIGPPAIVSVIIFIAFYFLTTWGRKMAHQFVVPIWAGAWISILVFSPIALYVLIQATAETSLFNESFWQMQRDRIISLIRRIRGEKSA